MNYYCQNSDLGFRKGQDGGSGDKTIKRAADMPQYTSHLNEAKIGYPNRFLSVAQVCPVSSGHAIASVRREDEEVDGRHILRSENGF